MNQKALARNSGEPQDAVHSVLQLDAGEINGSRTAICTGNLARHLRRIPQQHLHRHIHGPVIELSVGNHQPAIIRKGTDYRYRAALAVAESLELVDPVCGDDQHVAFLRLITPDAHRGHARLGIRNVAQLYARSVLAVVHGLRHGIGQTAGTHIVNQEYRVVLAHRPATVDHFLRPPLHLGITALHRGEIEVDARGAARDA